MMCIVDPYMVYQLAITLVCVMLVVSLYFFTVHAGPYIYEEFRTNAICDAEHPLVILFANCIDMVYNVHILAIDIVTDIVACMMCVLHTSECTVQFTHVELWNRTSVLQMYCDNVTVV
jgi:hypothetical protein